MAHFLVERYLAAAAWGAASQDAAGLGLAAEDGTELLLTLYSPDDETCFHLFRAGSADQVERLTGGAGLQIDRITPVEQVMSDGGRR
jgi:hypothetical protein